MKTAAYSDKGKKRLVNEDSFLIKENILGVADGMGGHQAGEIASLTALKAIASLTWPAKKSPQTFLKEAFALANEQVLSKSKTLAFEGMGTTLTVALINNDDLWIGHIGDSRAYLITDNRLQRLTTDHSLVNKLVKIGQLSEEEAKNDPRKHVITKAIGGQQSITPDITVTKFKSGDRLLLCTDGLTNELTEAEILAIASVNSPDVAGKKLVELANQKGGADNITVVIANLEATVLPLKKSLINPVNISIAIVFLFLILALAFKVMGK